jgi:secreted PhoX family phosphatase
MLGSKKQVNRRDFIKFLSGGTMVFASSTGLNLLTSCSTFSVDFPYIKASNQDDVVLAKGLNYEVLFSWGDKLNSKEFVGDNNDFISFKEIAENEAILWVNHEYTNPLFSSGLERSKSNVDKERKLVGGSLVHIKKNDSSQKWEMVKESQYNRRIDGTTQIPFSNGVEVYGSKSAIGTLANCAGGMTPWGTFLTCEENYDMMYGERAEDGSLNTKRSRLKWWKHYPHPPEHYGWVVEIEPRTGKAQKHIQLGRYCHECATCTLTKSGTTVIYSSDDKADEHLYKFIAKDKAKIGRGVLYVANLTDKKWLPLDLELSPILKKHFKDHVDLMINCRKAAKIIGASPLDRPEDIEVDPISGNIFISLTNNKKKGNYAGQILKISENSDYDSLTFEWEYFITGGEDSTFACPDNMAFDQKGNLWIATDISGKAIGKKPYKSFKNNGLFIIPRGGFSAGRAYQVASAPVDAEFTGICFDNDYSHLFLSVQHPGERSVSKENPTSHWPNKTGIPRSSVIQISGTTLKKIMG